MQDLTITLVQSSLAWEDPGANLEAFGKKLQSLPQTDLVILPEMFNTGFTMDAAKNAETMNGPGISWMKDAARRHGCVICGSLIIREDDKYYNRLVWMRPDGSYSKYDKKHLFRMGGEHLVFSPGHEKLIVEIRGWKVMPLVCYDLRFPVWSRNAFRGRNYAYDLLIYVANWPSVRATAWKSLLRARAIENMAYAAGLNRTGTDGKGVAHSGDSMLVAPDGSIPLKIASCAESMQHFTLDKTFLTGTREKLGVGRDWDRFIIQ
jgi:predicted amidohydrolase